MLRVLLKSLFVLLTCLFPSIHHPQESSVFIVHIGRIRILLKHAFIEFLSLSRLILHPQILGLIDIKPLILKAGTLNILKRYLKALYIVIIKEYLLCKYIRVYIHRIMFPEIEIIVHNRIYIAPFIGHELSAATTYRLVRIFLLDLFIPELKSLFIVLSGIQDVII